MHSSNQSTQNGSVWINVFLIPYFYLHFLFKLFFFSSHFLRAIIFCRTKLDCDNLERYLRQVDSQNYSCVCLHGDRKPQERKQNLELFKNKERKFLICTDVAARGIDISGLPFSKSCNENEFTIEKSFASLAFTLISFIFVLILAHHSDQYHFT